VKVWKFLSVYFLFYSFTFPAFEVQNFNSQSMALGGVSSVCEPFLNPATLSFTSGSMFSFNTGNIFGIKELKFHQIVAVLNRGKKWNLRFIGSRMGGDLYIESFFSMGLSVKIVDSFSTGVNLNVYEVIVKKYVSSMRVTFDMGFAYDVNKKLLISVLFRNIEDGLKGKMYSNIPQEFYYAVKYRVAQVLSLYLELYKDILYPFTFRMGYKVSPIKYIDLLAGYQIYPDRFSAGISLNLSFLKVSISYLNHEVLPGTVYYGVGCYLK